MGLVALFLMASACAGSGGIDQLRAGSDAYVARGGSPAWTLSVDPRVVIFDDGANRSTEPAQAPVTRGTTRTYRSAGIVAVATSGRCTIDGETTVYTERVQVSANGRTYSGCGGRTLSADSLAGSRWRVVSVKGEAVTADKNAYVNFDDGRFTAKVDCRVMSGRFVQTGVVVSLGRVADTGSTCAGSTLDANASQVLSGIVTANFITADRLNLNNRDGLIELRR